ncbi:hypothetical protein O181_071682 [Austropuccinia psidii MF-1]|uniref:Uncharacterized protein n=1 Tax=Austropuccinia psidii MF-1 TaxID=1389203 RepID=A0A9Q3F5M5_9BASI|nr:hypothetical protein [Austropuccinia psidii MF-1]
MGKRGPRGEVHHPEGQVDPKPQVGPPEHNFGPNLSSSKNGQKDPRTQIGHHLRSIKASLKFRGRPLLHQGTPYQRIQAWCIYGIKYHYAPFLISNPTVMFSGHNYVFPIEVPKSITHFKGRLFSHSVLQSLGATRRAFEDPNHLSLQELGCIFFSGLFQGVINNSISCQGIKYFSIPWTPQLVHTGCIQATCMALALLGQFIFHCGN